MMFKGKDFSSFRIFRYLKPYKWLVILTIAVGALSTAAAGGIGYTAKPVIEILKGTDLNQVVLDKLTEQMQKTDVDEKKIKEVRDSLAGSVTAQSAGGGILAPDLIDRLRQNMQKAEIPSDQIDYVITGVTNTVKIDSKWDRMLNIVGIMALLSVVVGGTEFGKLYLKKYIAFKVDYDLRSDLCRHMMGMSMDFFNDKRTGELMSNMTNDISTANLALVLVFDIVNAPLELITAVVGSFFLHPLLAVVMVLLMPVMAAPLLKYRKKIRKASRDRLSKLADLTQDMTQLLTGVRTVKSFRMEDREVEEFKALGRDVLRKSLKASRARAASTALTAFLSRTIGAVVTLGVGYLILFPDFLISLGMQPLSIEQVMPFLAFTAIAYKALKTGAKDYAGLQEYLPASERLFALFDVKPKIFDHPQAAPIPVVKRGLSFRNVSFGYDGIPVLKNINLDVPAGTLVAIVGHSGAGKSTLLDLIPRFYDPQEGAVELDGIDVRYVTRDSLLQHIAIVGQQPFLFNTTIAENIRYGRRDASLEQVIEAARAANIHDFIQSQPESYDTVVGDQGVRLSGGQRQRLTIARAILKDAPILILDEATSSLDNESEKLVQAALNNLMQGRTTFVIAHRLSTVQHADRIIVLKDGQVVEDGTHEDLLALGGEYARLYMNEQL